MEEETIDLPADNIEDKKEKIRKLVEEDIPIVRSLIGPVSRLEQSGIMQRDSGRKKRNR